MISLTELFLLIAFIVRFASLSIPPAHPMPEILSPPNSLTKLLYLPPASTAYLLFSLRK